MKKIALLLSLLLCLAVFGASAEDLKPAQVVGTWYCLDGRNSSYGDVVFVDPLKLDMNRDTSFSLTNADQTIEGTWKLDGAKVLLQSDSIVNRCTIELNDEGNLYIKMLPLYKSEYFDCILTSEAEPPVIGEKIVSEDEDAFFGTWTATYRYFEHMPNVLVKMPENSLTLTVEFALVTAKDGLYDPKTMMTNFADGILTTSEDVVLTLTDAGMLYVDASNNHIIFSPVTEEAPAE